MSRKKQLLKLDNSLGKVGRRRKSFASDDERRRQIALYAGAILVGVLVVLLAGLGIGTVVAEIIAPDKVTASSPAEQKALGDEDAMVVLALKLSDDHSVVENMVLVRLDPIDSRGYVCGLSPRVVHNDRQLGDYFVSGGAAELAGAVAELVDCEKVYTLSVDYTSMRKVINIFGGATITVPYAIKYDSPNNDRNLNVAPGTREYTGWEIARLLNYPNWVGGEQEQAGMYAMVVNSLINENMDYSQSDQLKKVLNKLYDEADTDITMTDFQRQSAGLLYMCSVNRQLDKDGELSVIVDVWPDERSDGGLEYGEEDMRLLRAAFGRRTPAED